MKLEVLVILLFAIFIFIIAVFVALYIVLRNNNVKKHYNKNLEKYLNSDDSDDLSEFGDFSQEDFLSDEEFAKDREAMAMEFLKDSKTLDTINESDKEVVEEINGNNIVNEPIEYVEDSEALDTINESDKEVVEEINDNNIVNESIETIKDSKILDTINEFDKDIVEEINDNNVINDSIEPEIIEDVKIELPKEEPFIDKKVPIKTSELVNVLIEKKNYIFLANNNQLKKGEHIKLELNKKVVFGVVTKGNYIKSVLNLKTKPHKLIIVKNKSKKANDKNKELEEFIPKKKSIKK